MNALPKILKIQSIYWSQPTLILNFLPLRFDINLPLSLIFFPTRMLHATKTLDCERKQIRVFII